ncbi:MAG: hypothetical protein WCJ56_12790 [bacterium]
MRHLYLILIALAMLLSTLVQAQPMPGTGSSSASTTAAGGKIDPVNPATTTGVRLYGKVVDVKTTDNNKPKPPLTTVSLKLFIFADDPNAPGKVPDEMVQQAAELQKRADKLEADLKVKGDQPARYSEYLRRMRQSASDLLRWRETDGAITSADVPAVPIEITRRINFADLAVGQRLHIVGRIGDRGNPGRPTPAPAIPDSVMLIRDALVVGTDVALQVQLTQPAPQAGGIAYRVAYYDITGDISSVDPLVLQVNAKDAAVAQKVQINVSRQFAVLQRVPLAITDLLPGAKISATVTLNQNNKLLVDSIQQIKVLSGPANGVDAFGINFPGDTPGGSRYIKTAEYYQTDAPWGDTGKLQKY